VEIGRLRLSGRGEAWRVGVVLVRIDPAKVHWRLKWGMRGEIAKEWAIERADTSALAALNAGMFVGSGPFGWTVVDGVDRGVLGSGALAPAFVVDGNGNTALVPAESLATRIRAGRVALAFQSYPELLRGDGEVPELIQPTTAGIDLTHRDGRLAIGQLRDGRWLIALTRFEGAGGALSFLPFGLTIPEMSALMGALGCARAVSLDGGVSAQLAVRNADGTTTRWRGLRKVALGLEVLPR
jgi:exopolysaccharide biosynthesis protein